MLAHAESDVEALGRDQSGLKVPLVNRVAVDYLLTRGNEMDSSMAMLMADEAFGTYEEHVLTRTPFFEQIGSV